MRQTQAQAIHHTRLTIARRSPSLLLSVICILNDQGTEFRGGKTPQDGTKSGFSDKQDLRIAVPK